MGTPMIDSQFTYTVSEVAEQSGVAASAIRFYEKHGIITGTRTSGNQRRFTEDAACRVKVARVAQRIGYKVAEIADLLDGLPNNPKTEDWQRLHDDLIKEAEKRIAEINAQLAALKTGDKLCELPGSPTLS
ncbi:MerR family transcriptional regulator [Kibdelosporangium phytohabitans]|nr:MerR family transcriptional regulator [Kibdelosporangium phytohabitans]